MIFENLEVTFRGGYATACVCYIYGTYTRVFHVCKLVISVCWSVRLRVKSSRYVEVTCPGTATIRQTEIKDFSTEPRY